MNSIVTQAVILARTDFGEADRILTLITPDYGKLRLMARGVRRIKSKLSGGIELFSVSSITFSHGRGEIGTLISTRLIDHYANIVKDIDRTMLGYDLLKILNKVTEDQVDGHYFELIKQTFVALDNNSVSIDLIRLWFLAQLLRLGGYQPNLRTDTDGDSLQKDRLYDFDFDAMSFKRRNSGTFGSDQIKFLRLAFSSITAGKLSMIKGSTELTSKLLHLLVRIHQASAINWH